MAMLSATQFGFNHKRERIYGIAYAIEIGRKIILRSSAQYKKYYMRGHQDKALYQFQLNGLTANQAMIMYEWMMGFPVNWTKEE